MLRSTGNGRELIGKEILNSTFGILVAVTPSIAERAAKAHPGFRSGSILAGGNVRGSSRKCAAITALIFAGFVVAGCSKKNDYGTDTTAATTQTDSLSTTYSASSTVPVTQDTALRASTSKSSGTKSTTSKTTKKY